MKKKAPTHHRFNGMVLSAGRTYSVVNPQFLLTVDGATQFCFEIAITQAKMFSLPFDQNNMTIIIHTLD